MHKFVSGTYHKNNTRTDSEYLYFMPSFLPDTIEFNDPKINILLEEATHHLGELNAFAKLVPDIDTFIRMHIVKEATQSSAIEGTNTNIDEAVAKREEISPERVDDWQEVQNYIKAMNYAISELNNLPLANRLLNKTHAILLSGVRGEHKTPGEIRKSQNWIGGSTIRDARFVPPAVEHVGSLMSDLEKYLHSKALNTPHLLKVAIAHYQFETIHPYLDGNGRLGRLLITLYLIDKKMLTKPILYVSDYFARYKESYYQALNAVRTDNDIEHWIKFFLEAVSRTAQQSCKTLEDIIDLRKNDTAKVSLMGKRTTNALELLDYLYANPSVSTNDVIENLQVSHPTARALINVFVKNGILRETTGFARNQSFEYSSYLRLFQRSTK